MFNRLLGVVLLKAPVYREIAEDQTATKTAGMIVGIVSLIAGFFSGFVTVNQETGGFEASFGGGLSSAVIGLVLGLLAWVASAWVLSFVAGKLGGTTDLNEMLRVTGFVKIFDLAAIFGILPLISASLACVNGILSFVIGILGLVGYFIGVREAAEFTTGKAVLTAFLAALVKFLIVAVIGGAIIAAIVGAISAASAVTGG